MSFVQSKIVKENCIRELEESICTRRGTCWGKTDDRLPKQCFPPAIVRLDNEQLQFHHICGGDSMDKNKSVHVIRASPTAKIHLRYFLLLAGGSVILLFRSRLFARDPIIRVQVCTIDQLERNTRNRSERRRFFSFFFLTIERKGKRDAGKISLRNTRDESQSLNRYDGDCLSAEKGDVWVMESPQTRGYLLIVIFVTSFHCSCLSLVTAPSHWDTDSDEKKKKTTTEPASSAACLPARWLASVFFGCIGTAGRTRHLMDRHPSITNECYNRLASYVSCQWRHAVRFIHTNTSTVAHDWPWRCKYLGCAESIRVSSSRLKKLVFSKDEISRWKENRTNN